MSVDPGLIALVEESLAPLGNVSSRRMMGGATLYLDGIVFAIADDGELWFKADAESDARWDEQGCERFAVTFRDGRVDTMNYRRAPDSVYDDPEAMQLWAKLAVEAGRRAAARRRPRRKTAER